MSATIAVDDLRVGMFIHLDLRWWAHPFALSSFRLTSPHQIATIKGLGVKELRWSPEKSGTPSTDAPAPAANSEVTAEGEVTAQVASQSMTPPIGAETLQQRQLRERRAQLAAQREANRVCTRQYNEAAKSWKEAADLVPTKPEGARATAEALTRALLTKMMVDGELCIRVLAEVQADRATTHALNVAVISLLMGRVFGFSENEMLDVGVGALLHDVGKLELPERVRYVDPQSAAADQALYREHVARGVAQGKRMGLSAGAMLVIAQHHEMADGSGFPQNSTSTA